MLEQFGFDFGDAAPVVSREATAKWCEPSHTNAHWLSLVRASAQAVQRIAGPARPLFWRFIEKSIAYYESRTQDDADDARRYRVIGREYEYRASHDERAAFMAHCATLESSTFPGIEYKTRTNSNVQLAMMYVEGVGSLVANQWSHDNGSVLFHPWRDLDFQESYQDGMKRLYVPLAQWEATYCADKLAYAGKGVANVQTFKLNGREYLQTCGLTLNGMREATAWSVTAFNDWKRETYTYESQCRAWDEGTIERGDRRGLVVQVRGKLCVLDGVITVYDDKIDPRQFATYEDEAEAEADEEDDEQEHEAEETTIDA